MKKGLLIALLMGMIFFDLSLNVNSEQLTPEQQQVMRQYQEAELVRQDSQTYVRVGLSRSSISEGPYHIERSPAKISEAINLYKDLLQQSDQAFGPHHPQIERITMGSAARHGGGSGVHIGGHGE
jgi:hypothetical protein